MKRVITIVLLFLFVFVFVCLLIKENKELFVYTIPKNYSLHKNDDRYFSIDLYSNIKEDYLSNSKLKFESTVTKEIKNYYIDSFYNGKEYVKRIWINYKDFNYLNEKVYLVVNSSKYNIKCYIGYISIYDEDIELLEFKDLYGNYSYINGELYLVGITIAISGKYQKLEKIDCGYCYGIVEDIKNNVLYPPEIKDFDGDIYKKRSDKVYYLKDIDNYYFIPIGYNELLFIDNACFIFYIDGKKYLLDNFYYYGNEILLKNYKNISKEANIKCLN